MANGLLSSVQAARKEIGDGAHLADANSAAIVEVLKKLDDVLALLHRRANRKKK